MTVGQIENNLNILIEKISNDSFVFDLLLAFGFPNATIKRLQNSEHNQLLFLGELALRKHLFFKVSTADELYSTLETLSADPRVVKHSSRFIIVTDFNQLLALDTKTKDTLDIVMTDIAKRYDFFLPWAGMEKATYQDENPADVKASLKMAKLYDELQKNNSFKTKDEIHSLNVFLTRLLFCYFAEDTNIFADNVFTESIASHTAVDGSDLDTYLSRLFEIFNTPEKDRDKGIPAYLNAFPYVNGGLFSQSHPVPKFTAKSRAVMIEVGGLNWSEINPDIFGSMIQAVVTPEHRGTMGMHYTSMPNIMKVIEPLFLDELYDELKRSFDNKTKLLALHKRIAKIKIFDPACGSGNFLIISYKKLRELEISILKRIDTLSAQPSFTFSEIKLTQFYGIELDDFAHEVAMLSLWLAEHQMNLEFYKAFDRTTPSLPLQEGGNIVCGNATRLDWSDVCPKNEGDEIYVLGNPPYLGASIQAKIHKEDMATVFKGIKNYKNLDYISCWFYIGSHYIQNINAKVAFVTTNSICQGEQIEYLWTHLLKNSEIFFAHQSFKWKNSAKDNAGVIVAIIGLANKSNITKKWLFRESVKQEVGFINAYLANSSVSIIAKKTKPISKLSKMVLGDAPKDGGNLILSALEKDELIFKYSDIAKIIYKYIGASEFIRGQKRWCLWIEDSNLELATSIPEVRHRIEKVRTMRLNSKKEATQEYAKMPHRFVEIRYRKTESTIIIPNVSSERREYIPIGFLNSETIIANSASAIYGGSIIDFGVLTSKMHMVWMRTVAGRLKTDYRYSSALVYNTFPFPNISQTQKDELTEFAFGVLDEREYHSEKTLAQLYDPNKMPEGLRKAHHALDIAIEKCYRQKPFESDEERLEYLFKMYEEMTGKENKR